MAKYDADPLIARFWSKVQPDFESGCWIWIAAVSGGDGARPYFWNGSKLVLAYRWVNEWCNGPIPEGIVLDHLCRTPRCVNPAHVERVTQAVNASQERTKVKRTGTFRCGHPATPENSSPNGRVRSGKQSFTCTICRDARNAARKTA
jgi:HNH endonuclease